MIFRFRNEEQAQQAWHKIEGWRQGFRLAAKLTAKFHRGEGAAEEAGAGGADAKEHKAEHKGSHKEKDHKKGEHAEKEHKKGADGGVDDKGVRVIVKLSFSDHEKLSFQRWLDRIPSEEPFKSAESEVHKAGGAETAKTEELFESLR